MTTFALLAVLMIAQPDTAVAPAPAPAPPPVVAPAPRPWVRSLDASLMATQNAYSDSWTGGEAGSLSWATNWSAAAAKPYSAQVLHKNTAKLAFGQSHSQEQDTKRWRVPVKSTDLIDLESVLQLTLGMVVDPFAAVRLETQFLDASQPRNQRYLNPATLTESFGAARTIFKGPGRELSMRLGAAVKERRDRDRIVDTVSLAKATLDQTSGGIEYVADYTTPLGTDKVKLVSKLTAYQALYNSEASKLSGMPNADYWRAIDVGLEATLSASITKYLMVNLYLQHLYDKEIDLRGRLKQTLSLGLIYSVK